MRIETLKTQAFYSFGNELGAGGLPTGVSGRVACLLSGGIDSPVAAWRMMRRGCRVVFVHFHSYPILSRASQEKARELARLLTRFQFRSILLLVPFGEIQQRIVLSVRPPLRVVIYRRMMLRIAEALARMNRAQALITGDVVGQVASQTIENLTSINEVATLPVLRPLIGMDKDEITAEAQRLGLVTDLDHSGSGLLHLVHAATPSHTGEEVRRGGGRGRAGHRRNGRRGSRRDPHGRVRLPVIKCRVSTLSRRGTEDQGRSVGFRRSSP